MEPLGSFQRVLNVIPREKIEGPLRNFLKANPWPHLWPEQRPKTLGACGPPGFWPLVWPWMLPRVRLQKIPWGTFNLLPREYIEYSRETPQGLHSPCYLLHFPTDCPSFFFISLCDVYPQNVDNLPGSFFNPSLSVHFQSPVQSVLLLY